MKKFFSFFAAAFVALTMNAQAITVAQAIEAGMALDSAGVSEKEYTVEGYVINPFDFSVKYMNQSWYMADSASALASDFQAYNCFPIEGADTLKVLAGDKVSLTGKLTKYWNKKESKYIIEIVKGNATFIEKVEGDHSAIPAVVPPADGIWDVANAIVAYEKKMYKDSDSIAVRGVVSKIEFKGKNFARYGSANIYVKDATGAAGEWEYYSCYSLEADTFKASSPAFDATSESYVSFTSVTDGNGKVIAVGDTVVATGKALKYKTTYELLMGCYLTSLKKEAKPVLDTISVAKAIELTMELDSAKSSAVEYIVEGYVVDAQDFSWGSNNQIFFMADDAENSASQKFEAYLCAAMEDGAALPVLNGDKILLQGKLFKYYNKADSAYLPEIKNGVATIITKVEGDRSKPAAENITVAQALEIGGKLEMGAMSEQAYNIVGYVTGFAGKNADGGWAQYGNQIFWIADEQGSTAVSNADGAFEVYQGVPERELVIGDKISVYTKIKRYNDGSENGLIESETKVAVTLVEDPKEIINVTVAQAMEAGNALADNAESADIYAVHGYVINIKGEPTAAGQQTYYLSDDVNAEKGEFTAYLCSVPNGGVKKGDYVRAIGKILKYVGASGTATIEISKGETEIVWHQGIENVVLTEKAQKVVVDGVLYIIRDNKMFNIQGIQVR